MTEAIANLDVKESDGLNNPRILKEYNNAGPFKAHTEMFIVC